MNLFYFNNVFFFSPLTAKPPSSIFVSSVAGMVVGDTIEIMLDNGELFKTTITAVNPTANGLNLAKALPFNASAGNVVVDVTRTVTVAPSRAELSTDLGG